MKAWALMLVVALGVFGMVLPAGAAKVQLSDLEMDEVSGGDSAAAASQAGLGRATASSSSNGIDGPTTSSTSAVVSSSIATAAASGINAVVAAIAGLHKALATAGAGTNQDPAGSKKTKESATNSVTPGSTQIGVRHGKCVGICP